MDGYRLKVFMLEDDWSFMHSCCSGIVALLLCKLLCFCFMGYRFALWIIGLPCEFCSLKRRFGFMGEDRCIMQLHNAIVSSRFFPFPPL